MAPLPPRVWRAAQSAVPDTTDPNKIGSAKWNADLNVFLGTVCEALKSLDIGADKLAYFVSGSGAALTDFTSFARLLLACIDDAAVRALLSAVNKAGDTMSGNLDMGGVAKVTGLAAPSAATDAATKAYVDALAALVSGALVFKGAWDASAGTFPGAGAAQTGWFYKVSVAGTVNGQFFSVGDDLYAVTDNASQTTYAANWLKVEGAITGAEVEAAVGFAFGALAAASSITASLISDASADGRSVITATNYAAMRDLIFPIASAAEAIAGTDNTKSMTPLRTADAIGGMTAGGYGARGLVGANNAGSPNTHFNIAADLVVVRKPTGGVATVANPGTLTNATDTAGPVANGRDQADAFASSSFVHLYWIWNGATLATLSSASAPPTGPTLPTGYTHWGYVGAVLKDGSGNLARMRLRGPRAFYDARQSVLASGAAQVETAVSLTSFVPANASKISIFGQGSITTTAAAVSFAILRLVTASNFASIQSGSAVADSTQGATLAFDIPNVSRSLIYLWTNEINSGNISARGLALYVLGFDMPNGAD